MLLRNASFQYFIFLLSCFLLVACGKPKMGKEEKVEVNEDFNKYIVKGPDTNIYPLYQIASSQRFPTERYGLHLMFDQNKETYWTSALKTNVGESVSLYFEKFSPKKVVIYITDLMLVANVNQIEVLINGKSKGIFGKKIELKITEPYLYSIQIIARKAEGENEVKFPFEQNTHPTSSFVINERLKNRYNSKSFGISEIEFYDENNQLLPVKTKPRKIADVVLTDSSGVKSGERYLLFDENTATGVYWKNGVKPTQFYINFREITPVVKLRIFNGVGSLNVPIFKRINVGVTGGNNAPTCSFELKPGENILKPEIPLIGTNFGFEVEWMPVSNEGYLSHIEAYDGAKWYTIEVNNIEKAYNNQLDSLKNYEIQYVLDNYVYHTKQTVYTTSDTLQPKNPESIPANEIQSKKTVKSEVLFRSNNTFFIQQSIQIDFYLPEYKTDLYTYRYEGTWKITEAKLPFVTLHLVGNYKASVEGTDGKVNSQVPKDLLQNSRIAHHQIHFEEVFEPILISY